MRNRWFASLSLFAALVVACDSSDSHLLEPTLATTPKIAANAVLQPAVDVTLQVAGSALRVCGDVTLDSQAQIDAFDCTVAAGVTITAASESIHNVDGLASLTRIDGNLRIERTFFVTNVDGLSSLTSIGGGLSLDENYGLSDLSGLSGLTTLGGGLFVHLNPMLSDLSGLSGIMSVGDVLIENNERLASLDGLENVVSAGAIRIRNNYALRTVDGLSSLKTAESIQVSSTRLLEHVDGLRSLQSVQGSLTLDLNDGLKNLDGLAALRSVGALSVVANTELVKCACGLYPLLTYGSAGSLNLGQNGQNAPGCNALADLTSEKCVDCASRDLEFAIEDLATDGSLTQGQARRLTSILDRVVRLAARGNLAGVSRARVQFAKVVDGHQTAGRIDGDAAGELQRLMETLWAAITAGG